MINLRLNGTYHRLITISLLLCVITTGVMLIKNILLSKEEFKNTLENKRFEYQKLNKIISEQDNNVELNNKLRVAIKSNEGIIHLDGTSPEQYTEMSIQKIINSLNNEGAMSAESKSSLTDIGNSLKLLSIQLELTVPHKKLQKVMFTLERTLKEAEVTDFKIMRLDNIAQEDINLKMSIEYRLYLDTLN